MEYKERDYTEMLALLTPLGFVPENIGHFFHPLLNRSFDFSATALDAIAYVIFNAGEDNGYEHSQRKIREAMGL